MTEDERKLLLAMASLMLTDAVLKPSDALSELKRAILGDFIQPFKADIRKYTAEALDALKAKAEASPHD
jgi:hypothetical protein